MLTPVVRLPVLAAVFSTLFFLFAGTARAQLTLEQALDESAKNNETSQIARLQEVAAEGELETARSDLYPTLVAGASGTLRAQEGPGGRHFTSQGTLTLTQPLFRPSALPGLWGAEHDLEAAKHSAEFTRRQLAFDTSRAFFEVLSAERVLDAATRRLERARANLANADARVEAELNSTNDVTRARLDVASARREVSARTAELERARLSLGVLIGRPVTQRLASPDAVFARAEGAPGPTTRVVKGTADRREDVLALREQSLAARELASEPHYRLAPSIDLVGQIRVNPDPLEDDSWHEETLTLALTWTIFDGGRYGDRRSRLARAEALEYEEKLLERNIDASVKSQVVTLDAARDQHEIAKEAVLAARTNTEETSILYQNGLARAIELTDANAEQFDAEVEAATARIGVVQAWLDLRFALGLQPIDDVKPARTAK
jgi:outer membrane protein TolC